MVRRLWAASGTKAGETVEPQVWEERRTFPGDYTIDEEGPALETARCWRARSTIWIDGSRFNSGAVGAACAWQTNEGWAGRHFHLGNNKEVFDAEVFAIYQALKIFEGPSRGKDRREPGDRRGQGRGREAARGRGPDSRWRSRSLVNDVIVFLLFSFLFLSLSCCWGKWGEGDRVVPL